MSGHHYILVCTNCGHMRPQMYCSKGCLRPKKYHAYFARDMLHYIREDCCDKMDFIAFENEADAIAASKEIKIQKSHGQMELFEKDAI